MPNEVITNPVEETTVPQVTTPQETIPAKKKLDSEQEDELNGFVQQMEADGLSRAEISNVVRNYISQNGSESDESEVKTEDEVNDTEVIQNPVVLDDEGNEIRSVTSDFDYFDDKDYEHLREAAANFATISEGRSVSRAISGYGTRGEAVDAVIRRDYENPDISDYTDHSEVNKGGLINPKTGKQYTLPELGEIKQFMDANAIDSQKVRDESSERTNTFTQTLPVVAWNEEEERFATQVREDGDQWANTDEENARFNRFNSSGAYSAQDLEDLNERGIPKVLAADSQNLFNKLIYDDPVIKNEIEPKVRRELQPRLLDEQQKLLEKYGITSQSQLANASPELLKKMNTEYAQLERNLINEGVNSNGEFTKRRRVYADMEKEYLDTQLNKLGVQASGIPRALRVLGNAGDDLWGSVVSAKASVEGLKAGVAGLQIVQNKKAYEELKKLNPDDPLPPGYYAGDTKHLERITVGERIKEIEESSKVQRKRHVEKLVSKKNLDDFQKFFYQPAFLDGEVTMRDITSSSLKQVPNLAISLVPVIGPMALEGGHIYSDTIFAGAKAFYDLPEGEEASEAQVTAYLETPGGERAVDIAIGAIFASSAFETLGNVAQLKAIFGSKAGRKVMGNLIKGNFKKAASKVGAWGKDQVQGVLAEVATELGQTTIQQGANVAASGDSGYWDVNELKETAAQTLVSTFALQGGGSVAVSSIKASMNGTTPSKRDGLVTEFNRKIDNDVKTGKLTVEEGDSHRQYAADYADALSLVPEGIKRENHDAAADLMVKKLELERAIEGKDAGMVKTKKDEIKLIDAQLDAIVNDTAIPTSLEKNSEGNIPTKPSISDQKIQKQEKIQRESILNNLPAEESQEIKDLENRKSKTTDEGTIETINKQIEDIKEGAVQDGKDDKVRNEKKEKEIDKAADEALPDRVINKLDSLIKAVEDDKKRFVGIAPVGIDPKAFHTAGILALKATKAAVQAGRSIKAGLEAGYASVKDMMSMAEFKAAVAEELGLYDTNAAQNKVINKGIEAFNNSSKTTDAAISESYKTVKGDFTRKEWSSYVHQKVFGVFPNSKFGAPTIDTSELATSEDLKSVEGLAYKGDSGLDVRVNPTPQDSKKRRELVKKLEDLTTKVAARDTKNADPVFKEFKSAEDGAVVLIATDGVTGAPLSGRGLFGFSNKEKAEVNSLLKAIDKLHPSAFRSKASKEAKKRLRGIFKSHNLPFNESKSVNELYKELETARPLFGDPSKLRRVPAKNPEDIQVAKELGGIWGRTIKTEKLLSNKSEVTKAEELKPEDISVIKPKPTTLTKGVENNEIANTFKNFIFLYNDLIALRQTYKYNDIASRRYPSAKEVSRLEPLAKLNEELQVARTLLSEARFELKNAKEVNHRQLLEFQSDFDNAKKVHKDLESKIRGEVNSLLAGTDEVQGIDPATIDFAIPSTEDVNDFIFRKIIPKIIFDEKGSLKPRRGGDTDVPGVLNGIDFRVKDADGSLVLMTEEDARVIAEAEGIEGTNYQRFVGQPLIDGAVFKDWISRSLKFGKLSEGGVKKGAFPAFFREAIAGPGATEAKTSFKRYEKTRKKIARDGVGKEAIPADYKLERDWDDLGAKNRKLAAAGSKILLKNNAELKFELDEDFRNGRISRNKVNEIVTNYLPTKDLLGARFDIRSTKSKEAVRDFILPYKVGAESKLNRLVKGSTELTPGKKSLINPAIVNNLSDTMPQQVYEAILIERMIERDVQYDAADKLAQDQTNLIEHQTDIEKVKKQQRPLIGKIKDPGTNKITRQQHLQRLLEYEAAYPTIVTKTLHKNGATAMQLAERFDVTLSLPSKAAYDTSGDSHSELKGEIELRYAAKDPIQIFDSKDKLQATLTLDEALYELDMAYGRVKGALSFESALWSTTETVSLSIARRGKGFTLPGWNEQIEANSIRLGGDIKKVKPNKRDAPELDEFARDKAAAGISGGFVEGQTSWTAMEQGELKMALSKLELSERPILKRAFREVVKRDFDASKADGTLLSLVKYHGPALALKAQELSMFDTLSAMKENEPTKTCL